jgi:hypothetical protein
MAMSVNVFNNSGEWTRYSRYQVQAEPALVLPAQNSVAMRFTPFHRADKLAVDILNLAARLEEGASQADILLTFARTYGLPGGDTPDYSENAEVFAAWLLSFRKLFHDKSSKAEAAAPALASRFTELTKAGFDSLMEKGILHCCVQCGRYFADENPDNLVCGAACGFQYDQIHKFDGIEHKQFRHVSGG